MSSSTLTPRPGADVEGLQRLAALGVVQHTLDSDDVGLSQVDDVDVVADARAVGGVVVITEDAELLTDASGGLRQIGDEVLRHTIGGAHR